MSFLTCELRFFACVFACVLPKIEREREKKKTKKAIHQEELGGGEGEEEKKKHTLMFIEKEVVISDIFYRKLCGHGHGQYTLSGFT